MKKNGYSGIEMLIVVMILGVVTMTVLATTSYAFKDKTNDKYEETKHLIVHQAEIYGKTIEQLKEEKSLIITLSDMIEKGYYVGDKEGNVTDPRNSKATLNGLKIKLVYNEDGTIKASIIEEE